MKPIFLDCEASSLGGNSYPIEIAWSDSDGKIESHLINPYGYPKDYNDWDPAAQAIHGLTRAYLSDYGENPTFVASRMDKVLSGKKVYTDAPDFDGFWCRRLFGAVGMDCSIDFVDIQVLLKQVLPMEYWIPSSTGRIEIYSLYEKARDNCGYEPHRAFNDVSYLIELYGMSRKLGGYYA